MGCSTDYQNLALVNNLLNVSQKKSLAIPSCFLCGWDAQEASDTRFSVISGSGRAIRTFNKDTSLKDTFGRIAQRNKPAQHFNTRTFTFQHFATTHEHIVAYREQLYGHVNNVDVSPVVLIPQQATKYSVNGEESNNNIYLNGVWSIAQKYNLASPSLLQYANWWQHRPQANGVYGITSVVAPKHEISEYSAQTAEQSLSANRTTVSVRQKRSENGSSTNENHGNTRKSVHQLTIGQQVDIFAKSNSNARYNHADSLSKKSSNKVESSQQWRLPHRIDEETRLEARDANCPDFGRLLQHRLQQLLRDRHIQNLNEETEEDPTMVSSVEVLREGVHSAASRRTGSAALQITGRTASAGASSVSRQRHVDMINEESIVHTMERPSLPTMPFFRNNSVHQLDV